MVDSRDRDFKKTKKKKTRVQDPINLKIFLSPSRGVAQPKSLEGPEQQLKQMLISYNHYKIHIQH